MFDKNYLLPADALALIVNALPGGRPKTEKLPIEESYRRIIAVDVVSLEDLPGFSRSTVDGYAVHAEDTFGAKETSPAYLGLKYEVLMGQAPDFEVARGFAAKIPTGGMLPPGSDAVIMLEHVQPVSEDLIEILRAVAPGDNVIQLGEDIRKGETVLTAGKSLRAQDIGALAGIGVTSIEVFKKPVVSFISTGDEIVSPDSPLRPGQVRDINSFTLAGLAMNHGSIMIKKGIIRDNYEEIRKAIEESLQDSDMVLISGGTSAGLKDMTAAIINDMGMPGVLFHGVSLKPGKPMIGGVAQGKPVLGLPGHPAATVVCFDLFIKPILNRLRGLGRQPYIIRSVKATMAKNIASAAGREDHIRVSVEEKEGKLLAFPVLGKSGLITTLVKADGIVIIPQSKLGLDAGEEVTVRLF
ncbi:MAG: molybdopterin molybdenumtransferase MoeA [Nitrospirae bacterium]|nr:molybdopterin molybdenumtransferase MoeA [Nitrospirota bacterium]